MRILRLKSANVMRLVAVDITPEGALFVVGGRNGAGKSSVLDSIAMALGGAALAPPEPIRAGESEGRIEVDLGELGLPTLKVVRRFKRERLPCDCPFKDDKRPDHALDCDSLTKWGPTTSNIKVSTADGSADFRGPQAVLDQLLGKLTFDPLKFKEMDEKAQDIELRRVVGIDAEPIDLRRAVAVRDRLHLKREYAEKAALLKAFVHYPEVGEVETPFTELAAQMESGERARLAAQAAQREMDKARDMLSLASSFRKETVAKLEETERRLTELREELGGRQQEVDAARVVVDEKASLLSAAEAEVPDLSVLRARVGELEELNEKVRANKARRAVDTSLLKVGEALEQAEQAVAKADEDMAALFNDVKFPIEGLGLADFGVTLGGLPFKQASSAEQLKASVAIGLALNPKLKVLLVRSGNLLDEDGMAALAAQAAAADAQVWVEWVTKDASEAGVFIEDGRVLVAADSGIQSKGTEG